MHPLISTIEEVFERRSGSSMVAYDDFQIHAGFETRVQGRAYRWDGMKRGVDDTHPLVVFQYTLAGRGAFQDSNAIHEVLPGVAFTAVVPSNQVYYLPDDSKSWTFFWMIFAHPYIVGRVRAVHASIGGVIKIEHDEALMTRAIHLFESVCRKSIRDRFALENSLFEFLFEYERLAHRLKYASGQSDELVEKLRCFVLEHPGRLVGIEEIARSFGLSRSHFSRKFLECTGLSPAKYVRQLSFEEAVRRLLETDDKLETIAAATGFADANHFCKVFRRRLHLSPGSFRKQML